MFQARKIAQDTRTLPMDAAAAVDRRLAPVARKCSRAEIERQDAKARAEHDPRRPSAGPDPGPVTAVTRAQDSSAMSAVQGARSAACP